uniref:Si:ch73-238c9.1 n=1 Tax=Labrus bergylta TaxID=56723 RepID=A0A3Q3NS06_9LABR
MNIGSKIRSGRSCPAVLTPTVDQILEDINGAAPNDPVFSILDLSRALESSGVESRFQQCRQYLELNERLQEVRGRLLKQREELRAAGEQLQTDVEEVRGQTL